MIGVVAAVMGVAGGELLIPTIVLLYGIDIKTAGSLSLAVSLPTMLVAFARYSRDQAFIVLRRNGRFVVAMTAGSIAGTLARRPPARRRPQPDLDTRPRPDPPVFSRQTVAPLRPLHGPSSPRAVSQLRSTNPRCLSPYEQAPRGQWQTSLPGLHRDQRPAMISTVR